MKTIGITYDLKTDYKFKDSDPADANAEFDHPSTLEVITRAIESQGFKVKRIGNAARLLEEINHLDVDIVFNISEGMYGRNRESQVPILLEMHNIPYVGSDALTLGITLDKIMAKKVFIADGVPTPAYFEIKSAGEEINADHLKFPLIVKPRFEGSSKGLSERSRVGSIEELKKQADFVINTYKQPALVEEFIRGEEFTVAIVGNDPAEALPVVQIKIEGKLKLDTMFYTFARIASDKLEYVCPAPVEPELYKKISETALRAFQAAECLDFGRVDLRVDNQGNPYVLEINPLPSLSTEDVFMITAKVIGITYEQMLGRIIKGALKRYNL